MNNGQLFHLCNLLVFLDVHWGVCYCWILHRVRRLGHNNCTTIVCLTWCELDTWKTNRKNIKCLKLKIMGTTCSIKHTILVKSQAS